MTPSTYTIRAREDEERSRLLSELHGAKLSVPTEVQALAFCVFMNSKAESVTITVDDTKMVARAEPALDDVERIHASNAARGIMPLGIDWSVA